MRTFAKIAALAGLVGVVGLSGVVPASADWYGRHHRYYDYYGGGKRLPAGLHCSGRELRTV